MKNNIFKFLLFICAILSSQFVFSTDLSLEKDIEKSKVRVQLAELFASDQTVRSELLSLEKKGYSFKKLYENSTFGPYWNSIDHKNLATLKRIIAKYGWPGTTKYGSATEESAWIIAQHADYDSAFQKKILKLMKEDPSTNLQRKENMALLNDRILVNQGLPQLYGTQGKCVGFHRWKVDPIKDPEHLSQMRHSIGLASFQDYQKQLDKVCFEQTP